MPFWKAQRAALGFLVAALCYRLRELADLLWRPVDIVLASRELSNLAVMVPTLAAAVIAVRREGLYGIVSNFDNIAAVWIAAYGLIRVGRWWRQVKPPERKKRQKE